MNMRTVAVNCHHPAFLQVLHETGFFHTHSVPTEPILTNHPAPIPAPSPKHKPLPSPPAYYICIPPDTHIEVPPFCYDSSSQALFTAIECRPLSWSKARIEGPQLHTPLPLVGAMHLHV